MNILFIDQFTDPGGAQCCLMDLLPEVKCRGWNPHLLAPGNGELARWCRAGEIPVHTLPLRSCSNGTKTAMDLLRYSFDVPRMSAAIRRLVRSRAIDLIYVNGPRPLPAVAGLSRCSWSRVPVIFHAHSDIGGGYNPKNRRVFHQESESERDRRIEICRGRVASRARHLQRGCRPVRWA